MIVIDAFTGRRVRIGDTVPSHVHGRTWRLLAVEPGFFQAMALIRDEEGKTQRVAMPVRWRAWPPQRWAIFPS